jgi:acetyl esterase
MRMKSNQLTILILFVICTSRSLAQGGDYISDPHLPVAVKSFLRALNTSGPPIESLSKEAARKALVDAQAAVPVDLSGIVESEKTIQADGFVIKLNIVRPAGVTGPLPAFIFIHGGGWILGDYPTHKRMVRDLAVLSGCAGVFVNYTPSPEAHYPQAIHEIYAATKWVAGHGSEIDVDGTRLAVVGNSVGGNMTAVTCLLSKERKAPEIKLQILMWPILDAGFNTESYRLFGAQRFLTFPLMKWMYDQYTTDQAKRNEIYASPLQATIEQLRGLPPALIQVGEEDILRDDGEDYGRRLDLAGVRVTTVRYNGMIHDFGLLNGLAETSQVRSLFIQAAAELRERLK